ncbi:MAG: peptide-methionine (R)-S-oxide reductase MsrB [Burkholderiales bacterium]
MKRRTFLLALAAAPVALFGCDTSARTDAKPTDKRVPEVQDNWKTLYAGDPTPASSLDPVHRTEAEWKKQLSDLEFSVLREEGTERPFSSPLNEEKRLGIYSCAGCALPLFTSEMKFDSGTGWPSFFTSIPNHLATNTDYKLVWPRTEYHCVRCGGHQGHVFDDGPPPTGQRWCNNGAALKFIPAKS